MRSVNFKTICGSLCALVVVFPVAAAAASPPTARGIVFGTAGARGVHLVGSDHQARMVTAVKPRALIRPGAVVYYPAPKSAKLPVTFKTRIGHVKQTYVLGVVSGTSVRLADGTHLRGAAVAS